jgi:S-DNA-T family DNA segregation ATPase FtsK/SpoIIIE
VRLIGAGVDLRVTAPGGYELGRAATAGLRIENATVSRQHALVVLGEDRRSAWIEDLGGANGTKVNGTAVKRSRHPLKNGDTLELGEVKLTVTLEV